MSLETVPFEAVRPGNFVCYGAEKWKLTKAIASNKGLATSPGGIIIISDPTIGVSNSVNSGQGWHDHTQGY